MSVEKKHVFRAALAGLFVLLLGTQAAQAQTVQLTVEDDNGQKVLQTRSRNCPNRPNEDGCVKVAPNGAAQIRFVLPGNNRCGTNDRGRWQISGIQLAMNNKDWGNQPLSADAASDFNADRLTGWINGISPATTVTIDDQNSQAYEVWYRVQASCTHPGEASIYLDPRIENTGRGHN